MQDDPKANYGNNNRHLTLKSFGIICGIGGGYVAFYSQLVRPLIPPVYETTSNIMGIITYLLIMLAMVLYVSRNDIKSFLKVQTGQYLAVGSLYFFSILFILTISLMPQNNPNSYGILAFSKESHWFIGLTTIVNLVASFVTIVTFILIPRFAKWTKKPLHEWPLYKFSFLVGFLPGLLTFLLIILMRPQATWMNIYLFINCIALGLIMTYILGYSHPKNKVYDSFMAKYLLGSTTAIYIGVGLLGIGALTAYIKYLMDIDPNMPLMLLLNLLYVEFSVAFTSLVVVYRYQYQTVKEIEIFMERGQHFFDSGKYADGVKAMLMALRFWAHNAKAHYYLGIAYRHLDNKKEAYDHLSKAQKLAVPRDLQEAIKNELYELKKLE